MVDNPCGLCEQRGAGLHDTLLRFPVNWAAQRTHQEPSGTNQRSNELLSAFYHAVYQATSLCADVTLLMSIYASAR